MLKNKPTKKSLSFMVTSETVGTTRSNYNAIVATVVIAPYEMTPTNMSTVTKKAAGTRNTNILCCIRGAHSIRGIPIRSPGWALTTT
jgi:hypothetical protein